MAGMREVLLFCSFAVAGAARAQAVIDDRELLERERPEAWAMAYMSATTMLTPAGETPVLGPGDWQLALDAAHVPALDEDQRRVGFNGDKLEDLNRSPVFARLRAGVGLPGGFVAELGYTPPLRIEGVRLERMWAGSISRRLLTRGPWTLSARAFGQHGYAQGDITCPADAVGSSDPELDPFDCVAPSRDRVTLHHYGIDLGAGYAHGPWHWSFNAGLLRMESEVQLDALVFDGAFRDRTHLLARDRRPFFVLGLRREFGPHWSLGAELLHVPLEVRRDSGADIERDPLTSLRLQMRWTPARSSG